MASITYGLIGRPLTHSFSSVYFNRKFESEHIDAEYVNYELRDISELTDILNDTPTLHGLNVTTPYKEEVIPYLASMSEAATEIGAVNVIRVERDKAGKVIGLHGFNSDYIGFGRTIEPLITPQRKSALLLGTGGAAKAVAKALTDRGIEVHFVSRRKTATTLVYEELTRSMVEHNNIIVNCTPVGMYPNVEQAPDFPYRFLNKHHLCYDLIYNPDETRFMRESAKYGAQVKNGLEMLLLQAFVSYEIWDDN